MREVLARLSTIEPRRFEDLFAEASSRRDLVTTFLVLLELIRLRQIMVLQAGADGPMQIYRREAPPAAGKGQWTEPRDGLQAIIEALIFASPDPVTLKTLQRTLDTESKEVVVEALQALRQQWQDRPGGLELVEVAGGYQIVTRPHLHDWVRRLFHEHSRQRLSVPALETLAVVAYRQPVTGPEIAEIRGVNTSGVLGTLVERRLVKVVGRKAVVGRPFLYAHDARVPRPVRPEGSERLAEGGGHGGGARNGGALGAGAGRSARRDIALRRGRGDRPFCGSVR